MTGLLRVRSSRAPYRRAGIAFGNLPLVLGPEHFAQGIEGLQQLAAIVADPVLKVQVSDADTPEQFRPIADAERETIIDAAVAAAAYDDPDAAERVATMLLAGLVGEVSEPDDDSAEREHAASLAAEAEAKEAEERAAAEAAAKEAEEKAAAEAAAKEAEEKAAAEAAAKEAEEKAAAEAAAKEAAEKAAATTEPEKGAAAPVEAKADAVAKPQRSSGRKPAAANTGVAKG